MIAVNNEIKLLDDGQWSCKIDTDGPGTAVLLGPSIQDVTRQLASFIEIKYRKLGNVYDNRKLCQHTKLANRRAGD